MTSWSQLLSGYRNTGAFNALINLYGFVDDHTFLTKSGDLGLVLAVDGVDDECLDADERDRVARRFEAAEENWRKMSELIHANGLHRWLYSFPSRGVIVIVVQPHPLGGMVARWHCVPGSAGLLPADSSPSLGEYHLQLTCSILNGGGLDLDRTRGTGGERRGKIDVEKHCD